MRMFVIGVAMAIAIATGVMLYLDEAVRTNNPWVLAFVLSVLVVPVAVSWGTAELVGLFFRRGMLDRGRSRGVWRLVRGVSAGMCSVVTVPVLIAIAHVGWEDWYTMAAASAPWSAIFALVGRKARSAHLCGACGYDLRGLTSAAGGRCPECGQFTHPPENQSVPSTIAARAMIVGGTMQTVTKFSA